MQTDPEAIAKLVAQKLPSDEGEELIRGFAKHSGVSFGSELTHEGYKDIPVSYLFCEDDLCVLPAVQSSCIAMIQQVSGRKVNVTSIKADHVPNLSMERETIDWILDVAGKAEKEQMNA